MYAAIAVLDSHGDSEGATGVEGFSFDYLSENTRHGPFLPLLKNAQGLYGRSTIVSEISSRLANRRAGPQDYSESSDPLLLLGRQLDIQVQQAKCLISKIVHLLKTTVAAVTYKLQRIVYDDEKSFDVAIRILRAPWKVFFALSSIVKGMIPRLRS